MITSAPHKPDSETVLGTVGAPCLVALLCALLASHKKERAKTHLRDVVLGLSSGTVSCKLSR